MTTVTKYNIGDKLYVYTKQGLVLLTVHAIAIYVEQKETRERYQFSEYGDYYSLDEIVATNHKEAQAAIKKNSNQLQLLLA